MNTVHSAPEPKPPSATGRPLTRWETQAVSGGLRILYAGKRLPAAGDVLVPFEHESPNIWTFQF